MKMLKFKAIILSTVILALTAAMPVLAAQTEEAGKDDSKVESEEKEESIPPSELETADTYGTIHITLTDGKDGTKKSGIKFWCMKVADLQQGEYVLTESYKDSKVDLNAIENSDGLDNAAKKFAEYKAEGTTAETDQNGELTFTDLEVGVYLLKAEDSITYDTISPSLIAIPTWNEQEGEMEYDVSVQPKHTPKPEEEKNTAPQTGLKDFTACYLGGAGICFLGVFLLVLFGWKKRKGKRYV